MPQAAIRFDYPPEAQALSEATRRLAGRFEVPFAAAPAEPEALIVDAAEEGRLAELEQALFDLGYLALGPDGESLEALRARILPATQEFLADAQALLSPELLAGITAEHGGPGDRLRRGEGQDEPSPFTVELLRALTSFDGEIALAGPLDLGSSNLKTRVLHYRLRTLNLFMSFARAPQEERTRDAIDTLRAVPGFGDLADEDLLTLLGDGEALFRRYSAGLDVASLVFRFSAEGEDGEVGFDDLEITEDGRFDDTASVVTKTFNSADSRARDSRPLVEAQLARPSNTFGIELLQLGLWMQGYYEGRLDAWWGPASDAALRHFIEAHHLDREHVLLSLGDGFWTVNFTRVSWLLFPGLVPGAETAEIPDDAVFEGSEATDGEERHEAATSLWDRIKSGFRSAVRAGRRVALGIRSLTAAAWNGVKRALAWVSDTVGGFFASAKAFVKLAFRSAREVVGNLVRALRRFVHFVVGKPIVTLDEDGRVAALSEFAADRDSFSWFDPDATEARAEHDDLIARLARGLRIFLRVLGKGLRYLLLALQPPPISYVRIAIALFRDLVDIVRLLLADPEPALASTKSR